MAAKTRLERVTEMLAPFLAANPHSTVEEVGEGGNPEVLVMTPWGDRSIVIETPPEPKPLRELAAALNSVLLPQRFSAIWHSDSKDLEVIWTAYNLSDSQKEVNGRRFEFYYKRRKYICHFTKSSDRLVTIAKSSYPVFTGSSNHRNLQSFSSYARLRPESRARLSIAEPLSFWIRNITWKEKDVIELVQNLNFYLSYYDDRSSTIIVHPPVDTNEAASSKIRYIAGAFPDKIRGDGLDDNLLSFWYAAEMAESITKFLLYYRIIEYGSTQFMDAKILRTLRQILASPHRSADNVDMITSVMDQVRLDKLSDPEKLRGAITAMVQPKLIWREISANAAFFSQETKFDGGFKVKELYHKDDTEARFCSGTLDVFSDSVRKIRNALSHGKDMETTGVITPTTRNFQLLQPWIHLVGTAAGEVVLHRGIT